MTTASEQPEPMFFHVLSAKQVRPGDVVHEIDGRPLRGGPLRVGQVRPVPADRGGRTREGWELVPQPPNSRVSRLVDADQRLTVGREKPVRRVNPIVAAAAVKPRRTSKRRKPANADQLTLFEVPPRRK